MSTAILTAYVESASNLPEAKHLIKPHPYFYLTLGEQKQKSRIKKHTIDPVWEQGFVFLVPKPEQDILQMTVMDKTTGHVLTQFSYKIVDLMDKANLEISKVEFDMTDGESKVVLSLQLRVRKVFFF